MGLILRPAEIKNCAKLVKSSIEGNQKSYEGALQVVKNFAGNEAFQSKSWDTAKGKIVESHQLIVKGIMAAQDSVVSELDTASKTLDGPDRNEDELIQDILRLEEECKRYMEMIKTFSTLQSRPVIGNWNISRIISHYQEMLEITKKELELVKEELNTLYDQTEQTSSLFQAIGGLLQAVEYAINDAEVYISGRGELSDGTWRVTIPAKIEELNRNVEKEWIPEVMRLDGDTEQEKALANQIDALNNKKESIKWNQEKIDRVWEKCEEYYIEEGVQVDPRLLLAIICVEGTGSFNTNSNQKAGDGGNGPQSDFEKDVDYALDIVGGKIIAYATYQQEFSEARQAAYEQGLPGIKNYDDILHYINWQTPRVSIADENDYKMISGVYAEANGWNSQVRQIYSEFSYDKVSLAYTEYALSLGSVKLDEITQKYGIDIINVDFTAKKNGKDRRNNDNGEYTVVGKKTE